MSDTQQVVLVDELARALIQQHLADYTESRRAINMALQDLRDTSEVRRIEASKANERIHSRIEETSGVLGNKMSGIEIRIDEKIDAVAKSVTTLDGRIRAWAITILLTGVAGLGTAVLYLAGQIAMSKGIIQ